MRKEQNGGINCCLYSKTGSWRITCFHRFSTRIPEIQSNTCKNERCQEEGKMVFVAIFYFNVFNNSVADFCTAQLWQPGLFNTIVHKLTDNFTENINVANIEITKFGNFDRGCINQSFVLLLHSNLFALKVQVQYKNSTVQIFKHKPS